MESFYTRKGVTGKHVEVESHLPKSVIGFIACSLSQQAITRVHYFTEKTFYAKSTFVNKIQTLIYFNERNPIIKGLPQAIPLQREAV